VENAMGLIERYNKPLLFKQMVAIVALMSVCRLAINEIIRYISNQNILEPYRLERSYPLSRLSVAAGSDWL
jgi:hypothetical protein